MKDTFILFRWDDGAFGLTGWGLVVLMYLACILSRNSGP